MSRVVVDAIHADMIATHGGLFGARDEDALEAALARPRQRWNYEPAADLPQLAAAYAYGIARNHPYRDGNKRVAFVTAVTFLGLNGLDFVADEADVVATMLRLAAGEAEEGDLAEWIRRHARKRHKGSL
ncbi:MAG: type II toxin-antitoxin system death-on-curing family toxin [Anaerosomatales bacterium]|nr:type II toxin-antitoxin system death-on-curing family toxin [Anaerosomatales bacterium]